MAPVADIDDTAGFMAAARALRASQASNASERAVKDSSSEQNDFSQPIGDFAGSSALDDLVTPSAPEHADFSGESAASSSPLVDHSSCLS